MLESCHLRRLNLADHEELREIYFDAVSTQASALYNSSQIQAWSSLAWLPGILETPLKQGKGWVSLGQQEIAAFALRYPLNRLALLYCRGEYSRKGHATHLLKRIELEALEEGLKSLYVEASLLSYKLLLRHEWKLIAPENIEIAGVRFKRYLMQKILVIS